MNSELCQCSDWLDVLCRGSFWSVPFGELNSLSLVKFFELNSYKTRMVEEQVLVPTGVDKSEAFVRQLLDRALTFLLSALRLLATNGQRSL